jgi:uncharacterized membrane protein SirB2
MIEFSPQIKSVHIVAVVASGLLFLVRGAALHAGMTWAMAAPLRYLSYLIDNSLMHGLHSAQSGTMRFPDYAL